MYPKNQNVKQRAQNPIYLITKPGYISFIDFELYSPQPNYFFFNLILANHCFYIEN